MRSKFQTLALSFGIAFGLPALAIAALSSATCPRVLDLAVMQSSSIRLVEASTELPAVVDIAAKAFRDDPLFTWVAKDPAKQKRFIATMVDHVFLRGRILVDLDLSGKIHGFALWIRSADASAGPIDMARNGQLAYALSTWPGKVIDLIKLDQYLLKTRRTFAGDDATYLYLIGVDPEYQQKGIGTRLIKPVLDAAQAEGSPVVLEIQKPGNRPYYEQFGFQVVQTRAIPAGAPATSTLVWTPR